MELLTAGIENRFIDSLKSKFLLSFPDTLALINFFFKNKFKPEFCNAVIKDDTVISSIQAFPEEIILEGKSFSAKYIYEASTLPNFRRQGYMKRLLNFTAEVERKRNTDFLFLVPCSKDIEKYYEKFGYENFFKIRRINLSNKDFKKLISENPCEGTNWGSSRYPVEKICNMVYNNTNYVKHSREDIDYAVKLYGTFFGGEIVAVGKSFALCFYWGDTLKIIYFCAKSPQDSKLLLHSIYNRFSRCSKYDFEVSAENEFFKSYSSSEFYGMIKPLNSRAENMVLTIKKNKKFPYLGLPLD